MNLSRRAFLLATGATALASMSHAALFRSDEKDATAPKRPNVIFILCDDIGFGDLGYIFQNKRDVVAKLKTPTLDQLASEGCILTDHLTAAPVCAPARASLLTGKHQGHCSLRDNQFDRPFEHQFTLGTLLQSVGYTTYAIGKWGLGGGGESNLPRTGMPWQAGFDHNFCYLEHRDGHSYYHHAAFKPIYEDDKIAPDSEVAFRYDTDLFTARTEKYITDHLVATPQKPFFMFLAYTTIHGSYHEAASKIACNIQFQVPGGPFPHIQGQWPLPVETRETANRWIHPEHNAAHGFTTIPMRRYATSLRRLDDNLGDLLQFLKSKNIDQDTVIIFTSDNGPSKEQGADPKTFQSAGPFRGFKRWVTEGGIREPAFARWPEHIPAGRICSTPSQFQDWMPTLATLAGFPAPAHSDGVSLLPDLFGKGQRRASTLYGEHRGSGWGLEQQQFFRDGDFIALRLHIKSADDPVELYNVRTDPHQDHNLASEDPVRAEAYRKELLRHRIPIQKLPASIGICGYQDGPRPYDYAAVPGNTPTEAKAPIRFYYDRVKGCPYLPDLDTLTSTQNATADGYVQEQRTLILPEESEVTFAVQHPGAIALWAHGIRVFSYEEGGQHMLKLRLGKGQHPIKLFAERVAGKDALLRC
ncbi:MAG: sulfatase-like hydrolase/transferase [Kiritimatiellia bacterium]